MWSQPWYPDDEARRPVQVSWYVTLGATEYRNESELPSSPSELRELVAPNLQSSQLPLDMDGHVSIIFRNEELLGRRFWVYDGRFLGNGLGTQTYWRSDESTTIEPKGDDQVVFTRRSKQHKTRTVHLPRTLIEEWNLMLLRIMRIKTTITGDAPGPIGESGRYVRPALLDYSLNTPLPKLLRNPVPQLDENDEVILEPSDGTS